MFCMFLGGGRKYLDRTHTCTGRSCKLHTEKPPLAFELSHIYHFIFFLCPLMNQTLVYEIFKTLHSVFYLHFKLCPNFFGIVVVVLPAFNIFLQVLLFKPLPCLPFWIHNVTALWPFEVSLCFFSHRIAGNWTACGWGCQLSASKSFWAKGPSGTTKRCFFSSLTPKPHRLLLLCVAYCFSCQRTFWQVSGTTYSVWDAHTRSLL